MEPDQVSKSQFKARALEYFRQLEASGGSMIVTDKGKPAIEVRRFRPDARTPLERLRGTVVAYRAPTEPVGTEDWDALA